MSKETEKADEIDRGIHKEIREKRTGVRKFIADLLNMHDGMMSYEEIDEMMAKNKSVDGKTICAIDAITFEFGKSNIKPESYDYLDKLAQTIRRSNRHVEVKGHTDNVGGDEFNMNLSRDRAKAVVNYLVSKGVNPDKLTYSYYGMRRPLSDNDTEEGRAKNRRVEFTIKNN